MLAMGVAGVALCCALPSLLAGGVLVAAAGWNCGVWAAIGVAGVAMGVLGLRWRRQRAGLLTIDPTTEPLVESGAPKSAHAEVAE